MTKKSAIKKSTKESFGGSRRARGGRQAKSSMSGGRFDDELFIEYKDHQLSKIQK